MDIKGILISIPQKLTGYVVSFLSKYGITVTQRWASVFLVFVSLLLIYLGICVLKAVKPLIRIALIILGIILLIGLVIPW